MAGIDVCVKTFTLNVEIALPGHQKGVVKSSSRRGNEIGGVYLTT